MSTSAVVERVRAAAAARSALRIQGAGTWLDAGRPVHASDTLSVANDRGIVEYVPGDLTMTVRAGTTLAEIDRAAREHGQWLPLAPWGSDRGTLGATVATAAAGPYAAAFGLPRDVVLGLEFVTGSGDVVRSGGRVVKNVAGFDLTRLLTGSWGTLGIITEVSVRLRALPQRSRTVTVRVDDAPASLADLASAIRKLPFAPFACELLNPELSNHLGLARGTTLLVELGGNATAVGAQLDIVRSLGATDDAPAGLIDGLRTADAGATPVWRLSGKPTQLASLWTASRSPHVRMHGSATRGVVRVIGTMPHETLDDASIVVERLSAEGWRNVPGATSDPLAESVRQKFDPARILNPGILGAAA